MTREQLQASEEPKFRQRRERLARQRSVAGAADLVAAGWFNIQDAIWWLALYGDREGSSDFLGAADEKLTSYASTCPASADTPSRVEACIDSHVGVFFARMLSDGSDSDWSYFDTTLELITRSWRISPRRSPKDATQRVVFTAALLALAALHHRRVSHDVADVARSPKVTSHFRSLRDALLSVADAPTEESCQEVLTAYRRAISIADYDAALFRGFMVAELLPVSAVAQGGDLLQGALKMFG